jgi:hypothetical protein
LGLGDSTNGVINVSFVLEVQKSGQCVSIEPVGIVDLAAARALLNAVVDVQRKAHTLVEVRLDRIVAVTKSASRLLSASDLRVSALAA